MSDAAAWILSQRWAILPEMLETIISVARRESSLTEVREALAAKDAEPLQGTRRAEIRDGVAIINMLGPIFPRANLMTMVSGGVSLGIAAKDLTAAVNNPEVGGIMLYIDSPGGEVTAVHQFAKMVRDVRSVKPITAYVIGKGASAAYWIASAAGSIAIDATAEVGSIGVVAAYTDQRKRDEKNGLQTIEIVSSLSPRKRPDLQTDEGRAQVLAVVDELANVFVNDVASNRGVTREEVLSKFGQGGLLVGESAVAAGMADSVMTFEESLSRMKHKIDSRKSLFLQGGF